MNEYLQHPSETHAKMPPTSRFKTEHIFASQAEWSARFSHPLLAQQSAALHIQNLSLKYRSDLPRTLDSINLHIQAGESIGIIGHTGCGKSTLIQALFYLYQFETGSITVDGFEPSAESKHSKCIDLETYRSAIALIPQDPTLFTGTLEENLTCGIKMPQDTLIETLLLVGLSELINTYGDNVLQMHIIERGANLSLGQRQLICLARCILIKTPIVIMDEATSAVDPASEAILTESLASLFAKRTRIIVAHRLSTVAQCDRIVWLERGKIRKVGSAEEVIREFC